ncbi:MAG TPA: hypothetical protein VN667_11280 [Burkholderiales bacterium]|nr:hypothetical protein [Burkholderiales bacterium]
MMQAQRILRPETVNAIVKMGPQAERIADRWAMGWKADLKQLETAGSLLPRLKEQAERESQVLADARQGGENSHLADHEILAMNDVNPAP